MAYVDNPEDFDERFIAASPFQVLNDLFGPRAGRDARAENIGAFAATIEDPADDPDRYAELARAITGDGEAGGEEIRDHIAADLIDVSEPGWNELNRQIGDALQRIEEDPDNSLLVVLQVIDEDPGDEVVVVTHELGTLRLVRWQIGETWLERLSGNVAAFKEALDRVPMLEEIIHSLDSTPPVP